MHSGLSSGSVISLNFFPPACVIHFRRFVKRGDLSPQTAEEDYHLITHALPCAHYRYRGQRLICAVNERLRVEAHVCEQRVGMPSTVNLHPQSGNNRKRHNNGMKNATLKYFLQYVTLFIRSASPSAPRHCRERMMTTNFTVFRNEVTKSSIAERVLQKFSRPTK